MFARLKGFLRRAGIADREPFKGFLRDVSGVIHVGAHMGQERHLYAQYRLSVLWIEPLTEIFEVLQRNLAGLPKQRAVQCLVTDQDGGEYAFHVTSNAGAYSSIFELHRHRDIWPDVTRTSTIAMTSRRLESLLEDEGIDAARYDALVMDTQGSELLVLMGAESLLPNFRYVKTEVADFEAYLGCCQLADLQAYLSRFGFVEHARKTIAHHPNGGAYYDVVYRKASC